MRKKQKVAREGIRLYRATSVLCRNFKLRIFSLIYLLILSIFSSSIALFRIIKLKIKEDWTTMFRSLLISVREIILFQAPGQWERSLENAGGRRTRYGREEEVVAARFSIFLLSESLEQDSVKCVMCAVEPFRSVSVSQSVRQPDRQVDKQVES